MLGLGRTSTMSSVCRWTERRSGVTLDVYVAVLQLGSTKAIYPAVLYVPPALRGLVLAMPRIYAKPGYSDESDHHSSTN